MPCATGSAAIGYDNRGNVTSDAARGQAYQWDLDGRLSGVDTDASGTVDVTLQYDALGRRVRKGNWIYAYAGDQVVAEYSSPSQPVSTPSIRFVYGAYVDEPIVKYNSSDLPFWYHRNHQYSIVAMSNSGGSVSERYGYDPHGRMTILAGNGTTVRSVPAYSSRFTYTGRRWDEDLNVYAFRARMYDAQLGRFLSRDPLGYVDGMNVYRGYFAVQGLDPWGMKILAACDISALIEKEYAVSVQSSATTKGVLHEYSGQRWNSPSPKPDEDKLITDERDQLFAMIWQSEHGKLKTDDELAKEIIRGMLLETYVFELIGDNAEEAYASLKSHVAARITTVRKAETSKLGWPKKVETGGLAYTHITFFDDGSEDSQYSNASGWALSQFEQGEQGGVRVGCQWACKLAVLASGLESAEGIFDRPFGLWIPGDWGYFDNTNLGRENNSATDGENTIYLGGSYFWAHPKKDLMEYDELIDEVDSWTSDTKGDVKVGVGGLFFTGVGLKNQKMRR